MEFLLPNIIKDMEYTITLCKLICNYRQVILKDLYSDIYNTLKLGLDELSANSAFIKVIVETRRANFIIYGKLIEMIDIGDNEEKIRKLVDRLSIPIIYNGRKRLRALCQYFIDNHYINESNDIDIMIRHINEYRDKVIDMNTEMK